MATSRQNAPKGPAIRINQPAGRQTTKIVARPPAAVPPPPPPEPEPAPAAAPARVSAARATARSPRPIMKSGAGFFTKAFIWLLLLSIGAMVGGGFYFKGPDGVPLSMAFYKKARLLLKVDPPPPPPPPPPKLEDDPKFKEILQARAGGTAEALGQGLLDLAALAEKYPGKRGFEELATQAKLQKEAVDLAVAKKVEEEKLALAKAAEAAKAAEPKVVLVDLAKLNPWSGAAKDTWVRWKKSAGGATWYEDRIVKSAGPGGSIVGVQLSAGDAPAAGADESFAPGRGQVVREEKLTVGSTEVSCAVVDSGGVLRWIPKEGRWAERLALKTQVGEQASTVGELGEEEIPIKGTAKSCIKWVVDGVKYWAHEEVPGFHVKIESPGFVAEAIDCGTDLSARPEFPKPPKAAEAPADVVEALRRTNPWAAFKAGTWARRKVEFVSTTASSAISADSTVVEVADKHVVLRLETLGLDGLVKAVEETRLYASAGTRLAGEETLRIAGTDYPCVIVESPGMTAPVKTWIAKEGRPGRLGAILKLESAATVRAASAVGEKTLRIGGREIKCLSVSSEGRTEDNPFKEELLLSEEIPGFEVLRETVTKTGLGDMQATLTVIEFGDNPARKTPIGFEKEDPTRLGERRVQRTLDEAEKLVIDASVIFRELADSTKQVPAEAAALRALLARSSEAASLFARAKETYLTVREKAPAAAAVDDKIAKIDRAVASLQKFDEGIKARIK
jgi:hypothetical protein